MGVWVIDVYAAETDKTPEHRALAKGATEAKALLEASKSYPNDQLVVSIGRAPSTSLLPSSKCRVRQLW